MEGEQPQLGDLLSPPPVKNPIINLVRNPDVRNVETLLKKKDYKVALEAVEVYRKGSVVRAAYGWQVYLGDGFQYFLLSPLFGEDF